MASVDYLEYAKRMESIERRLDALETLTASARRKQFEANLERILLRMVEEDAKRVRRPNGI